MNSKWGILKLLFVVRTCIRDKTAVTIRMHPDKIHFRTNDDVLNLDEMDI